MALIPPHLPVPSLRLAANTRADLPLSPAALDILELEKVSSPSQLRQPAHRAELAYQAARTNMGGPQYLLEKPGGDVATAWTYGQSMVASLEHGQLTGNFADFEALAAGLSRYREAGGGYGPNTDGKQGRGDRYYDDNAWIGLAFVQAYEVVPDAARKADYLKQAQEIFSFLKTGLQPDGGMIWVEHAQRPTYNTCTEGPASELALRLGKITGDPACMRVGQNLYHHMRDHLLIQSGPKAGLYADHVDILSQQRSDDIYSYNEGTPVGAGMLLARVTGDHSYLEQARHCATASLAYFAQDDRLWKQPPAFNAIYLRNLLLSEPGSPPLLQRYADRLWQEALNSQSGLFDHPAPVPLGHYGPSGPGEISTLDQAAIVQILSLTAFPTALYPTVT